MQALEYMIVLSKVKDKVVAYTGCHAAGLKICRLNPTCWYGACGNVPAKLVASPLSIGAYAWLRSDAALRSRSSSSEAWSARLSSGSLSALGAGNGLLLRFGECCSAMDLSRASRRRSSCVHTCAVSNPLHPSQSS